MIRPIDAVILAGTKLRAHRVRTGVITGVSGILFGVLIAVVVIVQGVFSSADRYSQVGLGDRYIVMASSYRDGFNMWEHMEDPDMVERVEVAHNQLVAKKQAVAKKYNIEYNPKLDDPSPVTLDNDLGQKVISENMLNSPAVNQIIIEESQKATSEESVVSQKTQQYSSVKSLGDYRAVAPSSGSFLRMEDGKEEAVENDLKQKQSPYGFGSETEMLYVLPRTLSEPFVSVRDYDPSFGELPVILPYGDAEKLLGLEKLSAEASPKDNRDRMREVYDRVGEVRVEFCYRNQASNQLLQQAKSTATEIEKNKSNKDYQKPSLIYAVPDETSCGPIEVSSDTRTATQKKADDNYKAYEQEVGVYAGEPEQQKITFRAVGVSADIASGPQSSVAGVIHSMLSSPLGYRSWNIPADLLEQVPVSARPDTVFNNQSSGGVSFFEESELLEFGDMEEARKLVSNIDYSGNFYASSFGSSSLVIGEMKYWFEKILFWAVIVVGIIATIILSGLVGRTVADSRRETAVFRSIGATRGDISSIYILYTFLFSVRVVIFAFILGIILACIAHFMWTEEATVGAELAYGAVGSDLRFDFLGFTSQYLPMIAGAIVVVGLVSVIIPILRNVRRNPINDMRDE